MTEDEASAEVTRQPRQAENRRDRCAGNDFWGETPDDEAAHHWFVNIFWPHGMRCPTCCACDVAEIGNDIPQKYRCRQCLRHFTIVTGTLMEGLKVSLLEWRQAVHIITSRPTLSSAPELSRRIGWNDRTARAVIYRLLQAAAEPAYLLREPAELDWTELQHPWRGDHRGKKLVVIALVGRVTRRVAGLELISNQSKEQIHNFVYRHLVKGMMLCTDTHGSNQDMDDMIQHFVNHGMGQYVRGPACTNLPEGLWKRVKRVLHTDYTWFHQWSLTHWLDGLRWWENHRQLDHPERVIALANGLRWKKPRRIIDQYIGQYELNGPNLPECPDCRNGQCLARRSRRFASERPVRADASRTRWT